MPFPSILFSTNLKLLYVLEILGFCASQVIRETYDPLAPITWIFHWISDLDFWAPTTQRYLDHWVLLVDWNDLRVFDLKALNLRTKAVLYYTIFIFTEYLLKI